MSRKKYKQIRVVITLFIFALVVLGITRNSYLLSLTSIATGLAFITLVRSKVRIKIDEREATIREKAAQLTYTIFTPTVGIGAFLLLIPYQDLSPVFAKGEFAYLESLGMVFAYLTLFLITIYAISYHFLNKQYGGGGNDD